MSLSKKDNTIDTAKNSMKFKLVSKRYLLPDLSPCTEVKNRATSSKQQTKEPHMRLQEIFEILKTKSQPVVMGTRGRKKDHFTGNLVRPLWLPH